MLYQIRRDGAMVRLRVAYRGMDFTDDIPAAKGRAEAWRLLHEMSHTLKMLADVTEAMKRREASDDMLLN